MTTSMDASKLDAAVGRELRRSGHVVLAVSGGLDSMVLLDVAARAGRRARAKITVATFDHASGKHSERAATFVVERAIALGLPAVIGRASVAAHTEADWRAARWAFLRSVARATDAAVMTAHTRDDQVETVLMRALRGAGARGLAALSVQSDVRRPLIATSRAELQSYAVDVGLKWFEDPTNRSMRYLRNRIRWDLLPALRRVRPMIEDELLDVARRAGEWRGELATLVDTAIRHVVSTDEHGESMLDVAAEDLADYSRSMLGVVWPELAARAGVMLDARGTRRAAEFTISSHTGARIQLSGGWELLRSRRGYELRRREPGARRDPVPLQVPMSWDRWTFSIDEGIGTRDAWSASLPGNEALRIRAWRPGDRLTIRLDGRLIARKVKYFLSDAGISGHIRPRWPVVLAGEDVVWIPGVRRSDAATVRSGRPVVTYVCDYLDRRS
jgi:tRNA(Ile)-lysidine synthase